MNNYYKKYMKYKMKYMKMKGGNLKQILGICHGKIYDPINEDFIKEILGKDVIYKIKLLDIDKNNIPDYTFNLLEKDITTLFPEKSIDLIINCSCPFSVFTRKNIENFYKILKDDGYITIYDKIMNFTITTNFKNIIKEEKSNIRTYFNIYFEYKKELLEPWKLSNPKPYNQLLFSKKCQTLVDRKIEQEKIK
jgi:hypothetical protein